MWNFLFFSKLNFNWFISLLFQFQLKSGLLLFTLKFIAQKSLLKYSRILTIYESWVLSDSYRYFSFPKFYFITYTVWEAFCMSKHFWHFKNSFVKIFIFFKIEFYLIHFRLVFFLPQLPDNSLKNQSGNISFFQKYFKIEFYRIHIDIFHFKKQFCFEPKSFIQRRPS